MLAKNFLVQGATAPPPPTSPVPDSHSFYTGAEAQVELRSLEQASLSLFLRVSGSFLVSSQGSGVSDWLRASSAPTFPAVLLGLKSQSLAEDDTGSQPLPADLLTPARLTV